MGCNGRVRYTGLGCVHTRFFHQRLIPQYYQDIFWSCGEVHSSTDTEGAKKRGTEQQGWHWVVTSIEEWGGSGQSSTDKQRASWIGTEKYGVGQAAWSSIRSECITGGKERHRYWWSGNRIHRSGSGGVGWRQQSPYMGQDRYRLRCSCRFRFVGLFGWRKNCFQGIVAIKQISTKHKTDSNIFQGYA